MLDIAELEYGYRARQLGLTSYVVHNSVIHHDVGRIAGAAHRVLRLGGMTLRLYEISPTRCYYSARNAIYFWLYQSKPRRMTVALRAIVRAHDINGKEFELDGTELTARCMLHETDHCDGIVFIDKMSPLKREIVKRKIKKLQKAGEWGYK